MDDFLELNAIRGLTPRQQHLLQLQALAEETAYDTLQPWHATDEKGDPLPCHKRKPEVLLGMASEKVRELVRLLTGDKRQPTYDGVEALQEALDQLDLDKLKPLVVQDLVVKGSCALALARLGDARSGEWEGVYLDPVWCEPIFVSAAGQERAQQVAAELRGLGVPLAPADGAGLFVPPGAKSHDLVFLRYEWVRDEEVAERDGGQARQTVRWRYRRDYLPNVIVQYQPVRVEADTIKAPTFEPVRPYRPHNWGVVPVAWGRSPYAKPGDTEGPSFLSPPVQTCARKSDYVESQAGDSVAKIAFPQLALIDLKDKIQALDESLGTLQTVRPMASGSGYVLEFKSTGQTRGEVRVLEINGEGPRIAAEYVERLKRRIEQVTGLVDFDQSESAGTLSGVALERVMAPLLQTVGEWQVAVGEFDKMLLRKVAAIQGVEVKPRIKWPRVIDTTPQDLTAAAQALTTATGGQAVMSQETAVKVFARLAEVDDVDAEVAAVGQEADEAMARARESLSATGRAQGGTEAP